MDTRELRNVLGSFVTGVTVVTTIDSEGKDQGVTANSFSSVSLDPPLVLWSQSKTAKSFPAFRDAHRFVVNMLAEHQRELSQRFATPGPDKFAGIATERRADGLPALPDCCAYVECRKVAMYPGGDHIVYLGEVLAVERNDRRPLAFARGKYMVAFEHEMNFALSVGSSAHLAHNDAVRLGCAALPELANRIGATVGVAVWGNRGATIIRWEVSPQGATPELRTGVVMSPLSSATGLLFGAHLPEEMVGPVLREAFVAVHGSESAPEASSTEHRLRLEDIRTAGCATTRQPTARGHYGISAPVFDAAGLMVLALCVVAGAEDEPARVQTLERELKGAAQALSGRLGNRQPRLPAA